MAEVLPENRYCYHPYVSAVLSADTQSNHTALIDLPFRTSGDRDDPGGYRRLAAIEGWVYTRPVKRKSKTFYFVYHSTAISVPDTSKCS